MILDEIAAKTRERIEEQKIQMPQTAVKAEALMMKCDTGFPFEKMLKMPGISFICEVKKASPSKGVIADIYPFEQIALDYEAGGASAVSVLTEPFWFKGENTHLSVISRSLNIPTLRKDFVVDDYMIYEAKVLGASAVLLICAILDTKTLTRYLKVCNKLGLSAVVEAHDEAEIESALEAGARIIGVNNRNLKDFTVDINNSAKLRKLVPEDVIFIAESGIKGPEDIQALRDNGVDAVLIGETLMRSTDRVAELARLRGDKE